MKRNTSSPSFFVKHPYLTTFFIVPTVVSGVVGLVAAVRGEPKPAAPPPPPPTTKS